MTKASVLCNGCPENLMDSARVGKYLQENGWQFVNDFSTADLVLFNACALTIDMTNNSLEIIKELQDKAANNSQLIVWGCLPKIDPETLAEIYQGPTFGEKEVYKLDSIIQAEKPIDKITTNEVCTRFSLINNSNLKHFYRFPILILKGHYLKKIYKLPTLLFDLLYVSQLNSKINLHRENDSSIFYIKVSTGCLSNCAYCAIRLSRGKLKSKPIDRIIDEFRKGLSLGYREFSLMGTDLGPYGRDLGCNLTDLLREMVKEEGEYRIGLRNVHPYYLKQMLADFEPILSTGKIWFMGVAAESGSNRILDLMRRNYTTDDVKECCHKLKFTYPELVIRTQFLIGFPTETGQDLAESMRLIDDVDFDFVEFYEFSPRPGTAAADMEGQVPSIRRKFMMFRFKMHIYMKTLKKVILKRKSPKIRGLTISGEHNIQ